MKKYSLSIAVFLMLACTVVFANPGIMGKHRGKTKNGNMINCSYCHTQSKVPRAKGKYPISKTNRNPSCRGSGCHPVR
ncbi:MAG TPA: hypothetical protein PLT75_07495 [Spirochaetota bacterium]|nr:hypothetical protein [Spirochaetota bacterium]